MPPPTSAPQTSLLIPPLTLIVATTPAVRTPTSTSAHTHRLPPSTHLGSPAAQPPASPRVQQLGIGLRGTLPWPRLASDMAFFARTTTRAPHPHATNAIIMGRKTWDSLPCSLRPLRRRINVVVSRDSSGAVQERIRAEADQQQQQASARASANASSSASANASTPLTDVLVSSSLDNALHELHERYGRAGTLGKVFVIGGAEVYAAALRMGGCLSGGLGHEAAAAAGGQMSTSPLPPPSSTLQRPVMRVVMTNVMKKTKEEAEGEPMFECDTFFPLDELSPANGWRAAGDEEVSEWVGEKVSSEWRDENDVSTQIVGFECVPP